MNNKYFQSNNIISITNNELSNLNHPCLILFHINDGLSKLLISMLDNINKSTHYEVKLFNLNDNKLNNNDVINLIGEKQNVIILFKNGKFYYYNGHNSERSVKNYILNNIDL